MLKLSPAELASSSHERALASFKEKRLSTSAVAKDLIAPIWHVSLPHAKGLAPDIMKSWREPRLQLSRRMPRRVSREREPEMGTTPLHKRRAEKPRNGAQLPESGRT